MGSDYGPGPQPFQWGLEAGQAFLSARERRQRAAEDRQDRQRDLGLREQNLASELEARASVDRDRREARALQRADLATRGVRFQPNPTEVYDRGPEKVSLPGLMTGMPETTFDRPVLKPGVTAIGDRGYYNPDWSAAAADDRRTQAAKDTERGRRDAALRAGGYSDRDRGLIEDAGVNPKDVGPLARELESRARRTNRADGDPEASLGRRRVNAAGLIQDYDTRTNQGLDYAGKLKVPDVLISGADSAMAATRDSTLADVQQRVTNRPSLADLLEQDQPEVGTKTWQQRRAELLRQHKTEADIERTLTQEGYLTP